MYEDIVSGVSENVEINGYPFYAQEITPNESFNRRELNRHSLLSGTEKVTRGKYIVRDFTFTTYIHIPDGKPDSYDKIFKSMMNESATVISPYMGGSFKAEVIIKKIAEESSPLDLKLEIQVIEIPSKSLISGDSFKVPATKKVTNSKLTSKKSSSKKSK